MGLNDATKRRVRTISYMLRNDKMNKREFLNIVSESRGKDFDLTSILNRASGQAATKYDQFLEGQAIVKGGFETMSFQDREDWIIKDYIEKTTSSMHNEKQYLKDFLSPQIEQTALKRDREIKQIEKSVKRADRAKAIGIKMESLKKKMGLSR